MSTTEAKVTAGGVVVGFVGALTGVLIGFFLVSNLPPPATDIRMVQEQGCPDDYAKWFDECVRSTDLWDEAWREGVLWQQTVEVYEDTDIGPPPPPLYPLPR